MVVNLKNKKFNEFGINMTDYITRSRVGNSLVIKCTKKNKTYKPDLNVMFVHSVNFEKLKEVL